MPEFDPIVYIVSAIGAEIFKDLAKHLGKKTYEIVSSLREPITKLGLHDYSNRQEIQNKLEASPEVRSEIEAKVSNNKKEFNEFLYVLVEDQKLTVNKFYNEDNEKVVNVETNYGNINM